MCVIFKKKCIKFYISFYYTPTECEHIILLQSLSSNNDIEFDWIFSPNHLLAISFHLNFRFF